MMAGNLHVRNLDDELIAKLKRRAARHGRSTEDEHREILRQALAAEIEPSFDILAAELRKLTKHKKQTRRRRSCYARGATSGEYARCRCQHRRQMGGRGGQWRGGDRAGTAVR
jgi:plasmid stability protein